MGLSALSMLWHISLLFSLLNLGARGSTGDGVLFVGGDDQQIFLQNELLPLEMALSTDLVSGVASVLFGIPPPLDQESDFTKLGQLISADPFSRPTALLVIGLGGISSDAAPISQLGAQFRSLYPLQGTGKDTHAASEVFQKAFGTFVNASASGAYGPLDASIISVDSKSACSAGDFECINTILGKGVNNIDPQQGDASLLLSELATFILSLRSALPVSTASEKASQRIVPSVHFASFNSLEKMQAQEPLVTVVLQLVATEVVRLQKQVQEQGGCLGIMLLLSPKPVQDLSPAAVHSITAGRSARVLSESSSEDKTETAEDLVLRTTFWSALLLVLAALIIALYFLFNIEFTRDTLLFSGAKLD